MGFNCGKKVAAAYKLHQIDTEDLKAAGKTILLASHNEEDIRILCDHVYEMDGGILRERTA